MSVAAYLRAVYPAISEQHTFAEGIAWFESLDYYYDVDPRRGAAVSPPVVLGSGPPLPYLPVGPYYSADKKSSSSSSWVGGSSLRRWAQPVRVTDSVWFSSTGARLGPSPSWTNVMAIVKDHEVARPFETDYVEIEQFGGPHWVDECLEGGVPCGLWANAWKGTGTFMRIEAPLVARSKATAIADLASRLDDESAEAVASYLGVRLPNRKRKGFRLGLEVLALRGPPCANVDEAARLERRWAGSEWLRKVRSDPTEFRAFARNGTGDPELDWYYGVCGVGPLRVRDGRFAGWDALLMMLSCFAGVKTILMDRSPNDNGRFMREIVDYDYPGGWDSGKNNPASRCVPPANRSNLPTPEALVAYWRNTRKFALLDPFRRAPPKPCQLGGLHLGEPLAVCRATKLRRKQVKSLLSRRTCFLHCSGAMSEVHSNVTDSTLYIPRRHNNIPPNK